MMTWVVLIFFLDRFPDFPLVYSVENSIFCWRSDYIFELFCLIVQFYNFVNILLGFIFHGEKNYKIDFFEAVYQPNLSCGDCMSGRTAYPLAIAHSRSSSGRATVVSGYLWSISTVHCLRFSWRCWVLIIVKVKNYLISSLQKFACGLSQSIPLVFISWLDFSRTSSIVSHSTPSVSSVPFGYVKCKIKRIKVKIKK